MCAVFAALGKCDASLPIVQSTVALLRVSSTVEEYKFSALPLDQSTVRYSSQLAEMLFLRTLRRFVNFSALMAWVLPLGDLGKWRACSEYMVRRQVAVNESLGEAFS